MGSIPTEPKEIDISVALKACDLPGVNQHVKRIAVLNDNITLGDDAARLSMLASARSLVHALETPRETMIKHCWAQPAAFAALTYAVDSGLFTSMAQHDGPHKVTDLAATLGHDPALLGRIMRHLGAMQYIVETGPDEYKATNFSRALTITIMGAGYPCVAGACMEALAKFHEFAKKTNYREPHDVFNSPLQYGYKTKLDCFSHFAANSPYDMQFAQHMGAYRQGRPSWMDDGFYPVQERLLDGFDSSKNEVLLVDVGGSFGHDIDEFRRKHPKAPGRLVVQDLPSVIDQIDKLDGEIERMGHDFFNEQPIKGARAYYMHSVLHDWPDAKCEEILARTTAAMRPGYSKLLVNENCIPDTGADWQNTGQDIMMLTLVSSKERTRAEWKVLLERSGLRIVQIFDVGNGVESLIEYANINYNNSIKKCDASKGGSVKVDNNKGDHEEGSKNKDNRDKKDRDENNKKDKTEHEENNKDKTNKNKCSANTDHKRQLLDNKDDNKDDNKKNNDDDGKTEDNNKCNNKDFNKDYNTDDSKDNNDNGDRKGEVNDYGRRKLLLILMMGQQ
ncbi:sterigmatocystin 8-o-methyltransferase [Colletotrichum karsti]|uniref:Sterigmatocystin 8-o-methyltransferase n=1 Tax=Colletotrichum karsti TaxID=1095194 RepID=A0A9P6HZN2_9PEZI|nr:sterigmatocystin 8-o-methyltransferase [Colletotrichum karsti]KAF9873097.1 sterigmatocystin 8-o-methyltransferase [Colletotrichum karsti]